MKDHSQASETRNCGGGCPEETRKSIATTPPGALAAYFAMFITLSMAGIVFLVVYEMIQTAGSPADTIYSIITNLWRAAAAALFFTLMTAGISKGIGLAASRLRQWQQPGIADPWHGAVSVAQEQLPRFRCEQPSPAGCHYGRLRSAWRYQPWQTNRSGNPRISGDAENASPPPRPAAVSRPK